MARVIVIDDALVSRKTLVGVLKALGYDVIGEGKNGEEAIRLYKMCRPDAVIMDVVMDGMDGLTASKKILVQFPEAKIVICSSDEDYRQSAYKIGARFITKYFNKQELMQAINGSVVKV